VRVLSGSGGDNEFAVGSFETWPDQPIAVPVAGFREQIAFKPLLVAAGRGGAPLDPAAAQVSFDGMAAACMSQPELDSFTLTCQMAPNATTIEFVYSGAGLGVGTGWAAFGLSLDLEESTPTGVQRVCAL
jgi:hypothetical protein